MFYNFSVGSRQFYRKEKKRLLSPILSHGFSFIILCFFPAFSLLFGFFRAKLSINDIACDPVLLSTYLIAASRRKEKKIKDYLITLVKISFAVFKITVIDFLISSSSKPKTCMYHPAERENKQIYSVKGQDHEPVKLSVG